MKKAMILSAIIVCLVSNVNAQKNKSSLFGFEGRVYFEEYKGKKGKNVDITLYDNNKKISSYQTKNSGKFLLDVERNKHYTVLFEKDGYLTKRVIIKTYAKPNELAGVGVFEFDVILKSNEEEVNNSLNDFPVSLIDFDKEKGEFSYNEDYYKSMIDLKKENLRER